MALLPLQVPTGRQRLPTFCVVVSYGKLMRFFGRYMISTVSLVGIGKLGAPMAACMAARGFRVKAVDLDLQKVNCINRKVPPVYEPGLEELLRESGALLEGT